jgi:dienelactone hydrolase
MLRKILIGLSLLILLMVLGSVYLVSQAQIYFPKTGDYSVARMILTLNDSDREETFTEDPADKRELQLSVYYPIDDQNAPLAPYIEPYMVSSVVAYSGMPEIAYSWIHHNSHLAPAAEASFPVLIFSPGFGSLPQFYASLLEGLASEGYVVIALAHPYSTGVVAFEDGRVLQANDLGSNNFLQASDETTQLAEEMRIRAVWVDDIHFVLESLPALNENANLHGVMDTETIGLIGHSFGGKALTEALAQEPRFLAGINLDGGDMQAEITLEQPYLLFMSDVPHLSEEEMDLMELTQEQLQTDWNARFAAYQPILEASSEAYAVTLLNSAHNTFMTDFTLAPSIYRFAITEALVGTVNGQDAYEAIRQTSVNFFNATLKGEADALTFEHPLLRVER